MINQTYPFTLPDLPYPYASLAPYIDDETMHYHHDKHFAAYITNLNAVLARYPRLQNRTLTELLTTPGILSGEDYTKMMNNAGGVYNHFLFFENLAPSYENTHEPGGVLKQLIVENFGSFENFKRIFSERALDVFGSGWACLGLKSQGELCILDLKNQQAAITQGYETVLLLDVWEHAYYLKYKNARADYITAAWNVLSFPTVEQDTGCGWGGPR